MKKCLEMSTLVMLWRLGSPVWFSNRSQILKDMSVLGKKMDSAKQPEFILTILFIRRARTTPEMAHA